MILVFKVGSIPSIMARDCSQKLTRAVAMYRAERRYRNNRLAARGISAILFAGSVSFLLLAICGNGWASWAAAAFSMSGATALLRVRKRRRPHWLELALYSDEHRGNTDNPCAANLDK